MADRINLSGDFRGSIINIKSTLTNVQQSVGDIRTDDQDARKKYSDCDRQPQLRTSSGQGDRSDTDQRGARHAAAEDHPGPSPQPPTGPSRVRAVHSLSARFSRDVEVV